MKRILICIILLLTFISPVLANNSTTELFLLPDQGFLRVEAHLYLDVNQNTFSFKLFPNAYITSLWTKNLTNYHFKYYDDHLLVTVNLSEANQSELRLDLNYEGFLTQAGQKLIELNQNSFWFPVFDQPISELKLRMTLPKQNQPIIAYETSVQELSSFTIFNWNIADGKYPIISFSADLPGKTEIGLEDTSETQSFDEEIKEEEIQEEEIFKDETIEEAILEEIVESETIIEETSDKDVTENENSVKEASDEEGIMKEIIEEEIIIEETTDEETVDEQFIVEETTNEGTVDEETIVDESVQEEIIEEDVVVTEPVLDDRVELLDPELVAWINQFLNAIKRQNLMWLDQHIMIVEHNKLPIIQFLITIPLDAPEWFAEELPNGDYQVLLITKPHKTGSQLGVGSIITHDGITWRIKKLNLLGFYQ